MQFRILPAFLVFCGSYLPLGLILLAQNVDFSLATSRPCWPLSQECILPLKNPVFSIGFFGLTFVCFLLTIGILWLIKPTQEIVILETKYIPVDLMNYSLPYVVSFMSIDYQDTGKFIGFTVFLGWMFWITLASGQIVLNPVLIAFGWRLYEVKYRFSSAVENHIGRALAKEHLTLGTAKQWPVQDIQIVKQGA